MLLDKIYMDIKDKIRSIFKENFLFNIISNKSDNVKNKQILNMTILTKNYYAVYIFSEFIRDKYLDAAKNTY